MHNEVCYARSETLRLDLCFHTQRCHCEADKFSRSNLKTQGRLRNSKKDEIGSLLSDARNDNFFLNALVFDKIGIIPPHNSKTASVRRIIWLVAPTLC